MNIAVCIPCYNEEKTIYKVVSDFRRVLPDSLIYVYDNNSTDNTIIEAKSAGAIIGQECIQGKGNVVRNMFTNIDADVYLLVDGDDTYPAENAPELISKIVAEGYDMVNGDRLSNETYKHENKRAFHEFGNNLVKNSINVLFKTEVKDIMTGYRAFSRKYVKNWPVMSKGFEIETEMTLHALDKRFKIYEVPIIYRDRPEGSKSKLNTIPDGLKVIKTIIALFREYKPLTFFGVLAALSCLAGLLCGIPVFYDFFAYKYIYHVPLSILAAALEMLALNFLTCGLILNSISNNERKNFELRMIEYVSKEN